MNPSMQLPTRLDHQMFNLLDQLFERPAVFAACVPNGSATNGNGKHAVEAPLAVDLIEHGDTFVVRASLPGFAKDAVQVAVEDGVLTIKAEHRESTEATGERFIHRERSFRTVARRIQLPSPVNDGAASAELVDGVLTVRLPKSVEAKAKAIAIR